MGRRSHTRALSLWMNGASVGTWRLPPHGPDTLQDNPRWVASPEGRPLSLSLPFDLLMQAGRDCVGALQVLPDDAAYRPGE